VVFLIIMRLKMKPKIKPVYLLILIYFIILTWVILFKCNLLVETLISSRPLRERFSNYLIPFSDIRYIFQAKQGVAWQTFVCVMNIIIFMPMGILLRLLLKPCPTLIIIISTTIIFELFQLFTAMGCFATTDLLLNTLGGIIGMWLYRIISPKLSEKTINIMLQWLCIFTAPIALFAVIQTCYFIPAYL
jgi:glycopeptide antibiotics resistance protein